MTYLRLLENNEKIDIQSLIGKKNKDLIFGNYQITNIEDSNFILSPVLEHNKYPRYYISNLEAELTTVFINGDCNKVSGKYVSKYVVSAEYVKLDNTESSSINQLSDFYSSFNNIKNILGKSLSLYKNKNQNIKTSYPVEGISYLDRPVFYHFNSLEYSIPVSRYITISVIYSSEEKVFKVGFSYCHKSDNIIRKIGNEKSWNRILENKCLKISPLELMLLSSLWYDNVTKTYNYADSFSFTGSDEVAIKIIREFSPYALLTVIQNYILLNPDINKDIVDYNKICLI